MLVRKVSTFVAGHLKSSTLSSVSSSTSSFKEHINFILTNFTPYVQTFVVYMNFHVCIMYVSCINTYRYIHEALLQYMKNTWNFMYHVLTNLEIITYNLFNYISNKIQKNYFLQVDDLLNIKTVKEHFVNLITKYTFNWFILVFRNNLTFYTTRVIWKTNVCAFGWI